jgi:hypothetical protein
MGGELVGRETELAVLGDCLAAAFGGRPRVVVCRGESGIGKTRLAEELVALAQAGGALVAWGLRRPPPALHRIGHGGRRCAQWGMRWTSLGSRTIGDLTRNSPG